MGSADEGLGEVYAPRIGSGGPAGTVDQVESAAARERPFGAARARGRARACIFGDEQERQRSKEMGGFEASLRPLLAFYIALRATET